MAALHHAAYFYVNLGIFMIVFIEFECVAFVMFRDIILCNRRDEVSQKKRLAYRGGACEEHALTGTEKRGE